MYSIDPYIQFPLLTSSNQRNGQGEIEIPSDVWRERLGLYALRQMRRRRCMPQYFNFLEGHTYLLNEEYRCSFSLQTLWPPNIREGMIFSTFLFPPVKWSTFRLFLALHFERTYEVVACLIRAFQKIFFPFSFSQPWGKLESPFHSFLVLRSKKRSPTKSKIGRAPKEGSGIFLGVWGTAGSTSTCNSKIRGALKDLELEVDLVHETTSGAYCGKQCAPIQV